MTSTTDDTAGHPDVDELSDLTEGLLPPSRAADIRRHLNGCALCADVHASLSEIRELLGTLPGPSHMPDDVATRIDAALAAEALLEARDDLSPSGEGVDVSRETSVPAGASVSSVSRETSSTQSALSTPAPSARPAGHGRAATGPGRTNRASRRRRTVVLSGVVTAAALGLGGLLTQVLDDGGEKDVASATAPHTDAAHTYSEGSLRDQVTTLLGTEKNGTASTSAKPWKADPGTGSSAESAGTGMQPNTTLRGTTVDIPMCIERAVDGHQAVLAADKGVYKGTRVYLVVTPDATDSSRVAAYLVDASCTTRSASVGTGKVLLTRTYARS
jgi:hypothetical protein